MNGKVTFSLCGLCSKEGGNKWCDHDDESRMLDGVWVSEELKLAVKQGYKLHYVFELWHWPEEQRSCTLFKDFIMQGVWCVDRVFVILNNVHPKLIHTNTLLYIFQHKSRVIWLPNLVCNRRPEGTIRAKFRGSTPWRKIGSEQNQQESCPSFNRSVVFSCL